MLLIVLLLSLLLVVLWALYEKSTNRVCVSKKRLDGKTAIVTGGTTGMGYEISKDFALRGAKVIIACPFEEEGLSAQKRLKQETENTNVIFKVLNLGSIASTRKFAEEILKDEDRLDILVNNAGTPRPLIMSKDGINFVMQVNYLGAFLLTLLLLPLMKKTGRRGDASRIVNTISTAHWWGTVAIEDLITCRKLINLAVYGNSKLCLAQFTYELSKRLKNCNVVVNNVDPGFVGTAIYRGWNAYFYFGYVVIWFFYYASKTPWEGAQTAIHVSVDRRAGEQSDGYYRNCTLSRSSSKIRDDKKTEKLWNTSIQLMGLSNEEVNACFKTP